MLADAVSQPWVPVEVCKLPNSAEVGENGMKGRTDGEWNGGRGVGQAWEEWDWMEDLACCIFPPGPGSPLWRFLNLF